jgi:hypothetical protein
MRKKIRWRIQQVTRSETARRRRFYLRWFRW